MSREIPLLGITGWAFIISFGAGISVAGGFTYVRESWQQAGPAEFTGPPPEQFQIHFQRGQEFLSTERLSDAFQEFIKASKLAPDDPKPHWGIGKVYEGLLLPENAEKAYRRALQLDPEFLPARKSLAMILYEAGQNREAIKLLKEIQEKTPDDPILWSELALNELRLGNPKEAVRLFEKYIEVRGKRAWSFAHLGRAHAELGEFQAAEKAYREAMALDPAMANVYLWLGQLLIATGRRTEADALLKKFRLLRNLLTQEVTLKTRLLRNPDDVETLGRLAEVRLFLGKREEALATLKQALQIAPDEPRLLKLLERCRGTGRP